MLRHDFTTDIGYWLHMCAHRLESMMNAELSEVGISYRQFQILAWLALKGDLSQAELARCSGVEPSTIVSVVDRMQRDGLIERKTCEEDRRKYRIVPTPAAEDVWKRVLQCKDRVKKCATDGMSKTELDGLRDQLMLIHERLEKHQNASK
ncbi:MarR family winged helix-turn-helix transcriptional regulator [Aeoliella mucimassa]|uniref:Transcriptional regulator SlyA n=1 Tax=Aeoliella mucimassa TaxID=2527972 RepID=A0A518AQD1_9BACT|nr:MarR family transcriptional regulator [Aeoliella mucimassa]QDU56925.1 Transcriptional regulator SlyA [Aeoliella mucimassa]